MNNIIENLIAEELENANTKFPRFASAHEGYAVLLEEVEETEDELRTMQHWMCLLWDSVKRNEVSNQPKCSEIRKAARRMICEAIQVAAMCDKFADMEAYNANNEAET